MKILKNLSILIVTYKSQNIIFKCLKKLKIFKKIYILDNSNDIKLKKIIKKKYPHIKFFISKKNIGYGNGNNFLLKRIKTNYALLLNPDTYITKKNIISLFNKGDKLKDFSIISPIKESHNNKLNYFTIDP